ncbi:unnamed protein product [Coffea canephora]|uniref:Uncharacterized protein n=1 Tax=Coffea canephora TaxID=49390 RepID=A0A068V3K0_COFCA|nr:unnamed protein product [Coffea canephora]
MRHVSRLAKNCPCTRSITIDEQQLADNDRTSTNSAAHATVNQLERDFRNKYPRPNKLELDSPPYSSRHSYQFKLLKEGQPNP